MALRSLVPALLRATAPRRGPAPFSSVAAAAPRERPPEPPTGPDPQPGSGPPRPAPSPSPAPPVDFSNTATAYQSRTSWELLRNLLVLRVCALEPLLQRHQQLLQVSQKLLGRHLFDRLMKMTFYGQFVAGEDQEAIKPLIHHNKAFGVGSILDYSVEEDISHEEAEEKEMDSCTADAERDGSGAGKREKQFQVHRAFGDRRDGVTGARTYFYANEAKCDHHMENFLRCIDASGSASDDSFCAIKLTALGRPQFLLQFSEVLTKWRRFFHQIAIQQGQAGLPAMETKLQVSELQKSLESMGITAKCEIQSWFTGELLGVSGTVDLLDWNSLIDNRTQLSRLLLVPNVQTGQLEPLLSHFTEDEDLQMKRMLQRIDVLAKRALEVGVCLMVDAEQTYFQPAISRLTLEMQRKFNTQKPVIFNTYQCYLKPLPGGQAFALMVRSSHTCLLQSLPS